MLAHYWKLRQLYVMIALVRHGQTKKEERMRTMHVWCVHSELRYKMLSCVHLIVMTDD